MLSFMAVLIFRSVVPCYINRAVTNGICRTVLKEVCPLIRGLFLDKVEVVEDKLIGFQLFFPELAQIATLPIKSADGFEAAFFT